MGFSLSPVEVNMDVALNFWVSLLLFIGGCVVGALSLGVVLTVRRFFEAKQHNVKEANRNEESLASDSDDEGLRCERVREISKGFWNRLRKLKVVHLQELLTRHGACKYGTKDELVSRVLSMHEDGEIIEANRMQVKRILQWAARERCCPPPLSLVDEASASAWIVKQKLKAC